MNNWVRVKEGDRLSYCVLDGKSSYGVSECNFYFLKEEALLSEKVLFNARFGEKMDKVEEKPIGEVIDLGYGVVSKKKGWPLGKKRRG